MMRSAYRWIFASLAVSGVVGVGLVGIGLAQSQKTLVIAVEGDVDTFDPAFSVGSTPTQTVAANVFEPLITPSVVDLKGPNGPYKGVDMDKLVGAIAESWQFDPKDPNTVIFKVRKGLKYTSGNPVTADDIVFGMRRIFESQSITTFLVGMGGAVTSAAQFKKIDEFTVSLTMKQGNTLTLKNMTLYNAAPVDSTQVKANATTADPWALDWFKKNQGAGTGPFIFDSYTPGDKIALKANPAYYRGKPKLDSVVMKIVPDPSQRILLLKSGAVDMADQVPVRELEGLKASPNIQVLSFPSTNQDRLIMHNKMAPFDNKLVRKAVAQAIPYELIVKQVYQGYARVPVGPIENGMPTSDPSSWPIKTDLAKAKATLTQAGFKDGKGLPAIKLSVRIGNEEWEREAVIIQDALSKIGMNVTIEKLPFASFNEQQQAGKLQLAIDSWISWVNDPYYHMFWNFYSKSPSNYGAYLNPQVDKILDENMLAKNPTTRAASSRRAQKLIGADLPQVFLASPNFNVVLSKKVTGYVLMNDTLTRFFSMDKQP
jgi:peptide/nickel transport system substrate-binding protein